MSKGSQDNLIHSLSEAGIAAEHPSTVTLPILAAPATNQQLNTIRPHLVPIACWSIGDQRFEFGSSFILPEVAEDVHSLAALYRGLQNKHGKRPVASLFGHADPVGEDAFNKKLSGRRAMAVYGMLTRRTELWEDIYSQTGKFTSPLSADDWRQTVIDRLLADLGYFQTNGDNQESHNSGDEQTNPQSTNRVDSVKGFQRDFGLVEDGIVGPNTRNELFGAYMDKHCQTRNGEEFKLELSDFLARGEDSEGKGDVQGCSEFNPLVLLSEADREAYSKSGLKAERDLANAPNRRVLVYLFHPSAQMSPESWPCPRVKEGVSGCRKRFWSNADQRLIHGEQERKFQQSNDTFACRFYQRLADNSPCERSSIEGFVVYLLDADYQRLPGAVWRVRDGNQIIACGTANDNAMAMVSLASVPERLLLEWRPGNSERGAPNDPQAPFPYVSDHFPLAADNHGDDSFNQMLNNLGFNTGDDLPENVREFQFEFGLERTGVINDIKQVLKSWHDTGGVPQTAEPEAVEEEEPPMDVQSAGGGCSLCGEEE